MKAFIVTGTSRGLGKALVQEIIKTEKEPIVYCLSRTVNESLIDLALEKDVELTYISYDLSDLMGISEIMADIMLALEAQMDDLEGIYLVNNAGIVGPVKTIDHIKPAELVKNVHVNLLAPMILTSTMIHYAKRMSIEKRIVNISSGAADHGYYGWSAYCASKAGINRLTETVGIEQGYQAHGVKSLSLAPGIVDTDMQSEVREATHEEFRELDRFIGFKKNGDLAHPEVVAQDIISLLLHPDFPSGANLDIRNMEAYINEIKDMTEED